MILNFKKNTKLNCYKNNKSAYSLLELSIVILIVSVLLSGGMVYSAIVVGNAKEKANQDRLVAIYNAIGNFVLTNKRLPCPASLKKNKNSDSDYGNEVTNCSGSGVYQSSTNNNVVYGMVPIKTLGIGVDMAEDLYESKIAYIVDKRYTVAAENNPNFSNINFSTASENSIISIKEKPSSTEQTITNDAILVLISYGANKSGAFNSASNIQNTRSTDAEEMENDITNLVDGNPSNATFNSTFYVSSNNSETFDDVVFYKRKADLIQDFNLMFLVPCRDAGADFANRNSYYGQIIYASSNCPGITYTVRKSKLCSKYGKWLDLTSCPILNCAVSVTGITSPTTVSTNTIGTLTCNQSGYNGSVNYSCSSLGVFSITGGSCSVITSSKITNPDFLSNYGTNTSGNDYSLGGWRIQSSSSTWGNEGFNAILFNVNSAISCSNGYPIAAGFQSSSVYITITTTSPGYVITKFDWYGVSNLHGSSRNAKDVQFQVYNGSSWVTLLSFQLPSSSSCGGTPNTYDVSNTIRSNLYRFYIANTWGDPSSVKIRGFVFYGY